LKGRFSGLEAARYSSDEERPKLMQSQQEHRPAVIVAGEKIFQTQDSYLARDALAVAKDSMSSKFSS
jgi:hypothetical protein